jgi:hypothetical protein
MIAILPIPRMAEDLHFRGMKQLSAFSLQPSAVSLLTLPGPGLFDVKEIFSLWLKADG